MRNGETAESVPGSVADEPAEAPKRWPSHNYDTNRIERPRPATWLHSLEGQAVGDAGATETTPQDAWKRGEALQRAFPQLTRKTPPDPAPALSAEDAARLEAAFAETRRRRRVLVRIALLMVWGAMLLTLAVVYLAVT